MPTPATHIPAYALDATRADNRIAARSHRGSTSCRRAAVAVVLFAYLNDTLYQVRPVDMLKVALFTPILMTICVVGATYGVTGLWRNPRSRTALCGLILNVSIGSLIIHWTHESAEEIYAAYRYNRGVIVSSPR